MTNRAEEIEQESISYHTDQNLESCILMQTLVLKNLGLSMGKANILLEIRRF